MNILILEDEIYFQNKIIDIVKENISNAEITVYSTISNCLDDTMHFDLGIIDISLPDGDGIKYIEKHNNKFDFIIFLTSMENRVFDAFGKNVVGFILKDEMNETLPIKLSKIRNKINTNKLKLKTDNGIIQISTKDIVYIQTESRNIRIVAQKTYLSKRQGIKDFSQFLDEDFVWINQSTIINLNHVSSWKKDEILLNNTYKVYASRKYLKPSLHKFMEKTYDNN